MPTLVLKSLKCNKTQDSFGSDDPYLCVDSKKVWGPIKAKAGETLIINENMKFNNRAVIQLWEKDLDPDDLLGSHTISKDLVGSGNQEVSYTDDGADYCLVFEVK